jgi:hypothetical protein
MTSLRLALMRKDAMMTTPLPRPVLMLAFLLFLTLGGLAAFNFHRTSIAEEIPEHVALKGSAPMPAAARTRPIPPIDAEAPKKTETATFAMG